MKFNALILSAGKSSRLGREKCLLPFNSDKSFINRLLEVYAEFGAMEIIVVCNSNNAALIKKQMIDLPFKTKIIINREYPDDRYYSIKKGLQSYAKDYATFIQNVDNPFTSIELLTSLAENIFDFDWCRPVWKNKGGHPVLIKKGLSEELLTESNTGDSFRDRLKLFESKDIPITDQRIIANINTIEDYIFWFANDDDLMNNLVFDR